MFKIDFKKMAFAHRPEKDLGPAADELYRLRAARLAIDKLSEKVKSAESALKDTLIGRYGRQRLDGAVGKLATVTAELYDAPVAEDWDKTFAHIRRTGEFDLVHRRLNDAAVRERWAARRAVPGVGVFHGIKVSVTKRGAGKARPKGVS